METGEKRTIIFFGDSNTYGYDPRDMFGGRYSENRIWTSLAAAALGDRWNVVNEGMNSGCIEIACEEMGAVPYLIEDDVNGLIYPMEVYESMEQVVLRVFRNWHGYAKLGSKGYATIRDEWNADVAAARLLALIEALLSDGGFEIPESGPLSVAPIIHSPN